MTVTTYKVTSRFPGQAYAMYENGFLTMLISEFEHPEVREGFIGEDFPLREFDLVHSEVFTANELKPKTVSDKIALFTMLYKRHKGITYRSTKQDRANIVNVSVTEQLLNTYFKATQYPLAGVKSITDYIKHYNEVRDLAQNGVMVKNEFPNVYDREWEKRISDNPSKLQRYWQHLRALGWKKVDGVWLPAGQ